MKLKIILLVCILLIATVLTGCSMIPSKETKALLAYQEILRAAPAIEGEHEELADASFGYEQNLALFGKHYECFALHDINQDGIPELIAQSTINFRWTSVSVYTYANKEALLLKDQSSTETYSSFEQISTANGAYTTYICEDNHIHSVWHGTSPLGEEEEENFAYILEGTNFSAVDCSAKESANTIKFHDIAKANTKANVNAITK